MIQPEIHIIIFFTEGESIDSGSNLSLAMKIYKEKLKEHFNNIIILSPSKLIKKNKKWVNIFEDQSTYMENQINKYKVNIRWNRNWARMNNLLWKPEIIYDQLINNDAIKFGDIVFYHDVDVKRYPSYLLNIEKLNEFIKKNMKNKSVLLFRDSLNPLSVDTKVEILQKYLFCKGKRIFHVWAGSFGIKKNAVGIMFAKLWLDISRKRSNRSQFSEKKQQKYFYWHSIDQSTLSIAYYISLISKKFKKNCSIKYLNNSRIIPCQPIFKDIKTLIKFLRDYLKILISSLWFEFHKRTIINKYLKTPLKVYLKNIPEPYISNDKIL